MVYTSLLPSNCNIASKSQAIYGRNTTIIGIAKAGRAEVEGEQIRNALMSQSAVLKMRIHSS